MNKTDLIAKISEATKEKEFTKVQIETVLNEALSIIKKTTKKEDVTLIGFGTFSKSKRKAREGRNPQTGEKIKIPAMTVPKFRPGKEFKELLR